MTVNKAVIPAAGMGTRLFPATKAQPKEMLIVGDRPVIHYVVEEALAADIEDILIITGKHKRAIEDYFDSYHSKEILRDRNKHDRLEKVERIENMDCNIHYIRQKKPEGLGDAILQSKAFVGNEDFAVLLGDSFFHPDKNCLREMIDTHNQRDHASIISAEKLPESKISSHGILDVENTDDGMHIVRDAVEKPPVEKAPSNLGIGPRYVLSPEIFTSLKETEPDEDGELQLTDAIVHMIKKHNVETFAYEYDQKRYHISDHETYQKAFQDLAEY